MTASSIILTPREVLFLKLKQQTTIRRAVARLRDPQPFVVGAMIDVKEPFAMVDRRAPGTHPRTLKRRAKGVRGPTPATVAREHWRPVYAADGPQTLGMPWFPAAQMPLFLSRLSLQVVSVRREPLQAITQAGAIENGADHCGSGNDDHVGGDPFVCDFAAQWDRDADDLDDESITWDQNPEVWAVQVAPVFSSHAHP